MSNIDKLTRILNMDYLSWLYYPFKKYIIIKQYYDGTNNKDYLIEILNVFIENPDLIDLMEELQSLERSKLIEFIEELEENVLNIKGLAILTGIPLVTSVITPENLKKSLILCTFLMAIGGTIKIINDKTIRKRKQEIYDNLSSSIYSELSENMYFARFYEIFDILSKVPDFKDFFTTINNPQLLENYILQ